jgi:hypothetical protein
MVRKQIHLAREHDRKLRAAIFLDTSALVPHSGLTVEVVN